MARRIHPDAVPGAETPRSPLVSVIVPCHDRTDLLVECLASVAAQTYPAIEVIVIDDASTEDVHAAVDSISWLDTCSVEILRSEVNVGPGAARELGRVRARGEFLSYLDSDDLWAATFVERQVTVLLDHPEAGFSYCVSREFERTPITGSEPLRRMSDQEHRSLLPVVLEKRPWSTASCMWTSNASDRIGPWSPLWNWEDREYDCRAGCLAVGVTFVGEALCFKRRSGTSISQEYSPRMSESLAEAILRMDEAIERSGRRDDPAIAQGIDQLLVTSALALLGRGELASADLALRRLRGNSRDRRMRSFARLVLITRRVAGATMAARVGARIRPATGRLQDEA